MKWIEFSNELPEFNKDVLAVYNEGSMEIIDIQDFSGTIVICDYNGYTLVSDSNYTHWMYLPDKPKN